jgi:hypothetical protein
VYEIDYDRHVYDGQNWVYVNLPMDRIKEMAIASIKDNTALYFSCDVGKFLDRGKGVADTGNFDYQSLFGIEYGMDKKDRILTHASGSTHAMTLIAVDIKDGKPVEGAEVLGFQSSNGGNGKLDCIPFGNDYAVVLYSLDSNYKETQAAIVTDYEKCGVLTAPTASYQPGIFYIHTVNRIEVDLEYALKSEAITSYEVETYTDEALTEKVPEGCGTLTPSVEDGQIVGNFLEFTPETGKTYYFRIKALADESIKAEESDWGPVTSFYAMEE